MHVSFTKSEVNMIVISISTTYERMNTILHGQFPSDSNFVYVISCQGNKEKPDFYYVDAIENIFGKDCHVLLLDGYGLSENRNASLKFSSELEDCDYIYIADDDITINTDGLIRLADILTLNACDFGCGMIWIKSGAFKSYNKSVRKINRINSANISSVELMISRDFVYNNKIFFDTRFGLGTNLPSGEEYIYCNDAISAGAKGYFFPIYLCEHPAVSSGKDFFTNDMKISAKGAMIRRVFGKYIGIFIVLIFSIKKYNLYKSEIPAKRFIPLMFNGFKLLNTK